MREQKQASPKHERAFSRNALVAPRPIGAYYRFSGAHVNENRPKHVGLPRVYPHSPA